MYLSCKVLYFILSDDDFEIKSKIYSFNLRLVLKHILHSRDVFFRNFGITFLNCRLVMVFGLLWQVPKIIQQNFLFPALGHYHVDLDLSVKT